MNETFQVVKSKKRRKGKHSGKRHIGSELIVEYLHIDAASLQAKINKARNTISESSIVSDIIDKVSLHRKDFDTLLCYGLGSFSDSSISLHQLACLLLLKEKFKAKTSAYDPVFTPCDIDALLHLGVDVLVKNDEGKTPVAATGNTLVYFPHVPSQLVNNFLWANWKPSLSNCIIISNSFSSVIERHFDQPQGLEFIRRILPVCEEHLIANSFPLNTVFNDLAVHTFLATETIDPEFWESPLEPSYNNATVEYFEKDLVILMRKL